MTTAAPLHRQAVVIDATLGMGGHSEAILRRFPDVRLVGIDRDPEALARAGIWEEAAALLRDFFASRR